MKYTRMWKFNICINFELYYNNCSFTHFRWRKYIGCTHTYKYTIWKFCKNLFLYLIWENVLKNWRLLLLLLLRRRRMLTMLLMLVWCSNSSCLRKIINKYYKSFWFLNFFLGICICGFFTLLLLVEMLCICTFIVYCIMSINK